MLTVYDNINIVVGTMSRSALWRQEGAKKEQEKQAEELFQLAVEEGRVRPTLVWGGHSALLMSWAVGPMSCGTTTFF
jgi:hypothetical protein